MWPKMIHAANSQLKHVPLPKNMPFSHLRNMNTHEISATFEVRGLPNGTDWIHHCNFCRVHEAILGREDESRVVPSHIAMVVVIRPSSHRTRKLICMQICVQTL